MTRPSKCRTVCVAPGCRVFSARGGSGGQVELELDELETLRLADLEGLEQDAAAERMGVSRGTFQRILYSARKKAADALTNGKGIRIFGGNCEIASKPCGAKACCSKCRFETVKKQIAKPKGEAMIIAITTEGNDVFQHFGQCRQFTLAHIENGVVVGRKLVNPENGGHGMHASFLAESNVETLICGGIGPGAQQMLAEQGIKTLAGVQGSVDDALKNFLAGSLSASAEATCNHHHDDGHEHSCTCSAHKH